MADRPSHAFEIAIAAAIGLLVGSVRPVLSTALPATAALPAPRARTLRTTVLEVIDRLGVDNTTLVAAGVAFYAFLALFPAVAALVAVFGLVADPHIVTEQVSELAGLLPQAALDLMLGVVKSVAEKPPGQLGITFAISVAIALWSARAGVTSLMSGLDIAYRNKKVRSFIASTAVGLALTLGSVVVAAALVATIAGLPAIYAAAPVTFMTYGGPLFAWARWPGVALVMMLALAVLYRIAPSQPRPHWRVFSAGTLVATGLWLASSSAFSLYVTWSGSYNATYGSLAGAVVMMLWLWTSALAILVGATIDACLDPDIP